MLRLDDDRAIIQTVDFFAPVVDDPYEFGAIAAANSMSDVFAMGGTVVMGLNIAAFPDNLDTSILGEIFRGGSDKMREAGGIIAGGHTVTDDEPKYGIAVTGTIHPDKIWTKAGAKAGDQVYLTKPLGTGVLTTAAKQSAIDRQTLQPAIDWMLQLNLTARNVAAEHKITAATDITGFGLLGHAHEIAQRSGVQLLIAASSLPVLPHVELLIRDGVIAGGLGRNRDHYLSDQAAVTIDRGCDPSREALGFDPQTSGGLLFSVPESTATAFEKAFSDREHPCWHIGVVADGLGVRLTNDLAS
ncbi:selenide, water dikinase SelD [soil metagenome]